jgi:hypothetical protein
MMNGPGRQPAQPIVEDLQGFDVGGNWFEHWCRLAERGAPEKRCNARRVNLENIPFPSALLSHGSPNGQTLIRFATARWVVIGRQTDADAGVLLCVACIPSEFAMLSS